MPISTVIHTNEQSIDRVLAAGAPVLLVFWSKPTPLAATVEGTLDKLAQQYAGKAIIAKVDAETERNLAAQVCAAGTACHRAHAQRQGRRYANRGRSETRR